MQDRKKIRLSFGFVAYIRRPLGDSKRRRRRLSGREEDEHARNCSGFCQEVKTLMMRSKNGFWDFPKGRFDYKQDAIQGVHFTDDRQGLFTAFRELGTVA
mmetsp:Transcript_788/g.1172  ORF Transcript_788/g.1172 Transcript_788/m.1172 type:complete len:100 (-) Transcript_788:140-439(-)